MDIVDQVSLLPWISIKNLQIGNVIFWKYKSDLVHDQEIKNYLDEYVNCYVDEHLQPVKELTIVSFKDKNNFKQLTNEQYQEVNSARNILCFLCISEQSRIALNMNNYSVGPPSADIFDMKYQNFVAGSDGIAIRSGSAISGGWTLKEVNFQKPWSTGGFFRNINIDVLLAINKLINSQKNKRFKNRLFRSLEWFRLAHIENDSVSPFFKIIMLASAFEIILDIPNISDKSIYFAESVEKKLTEARFKKRTRKYGKKKDNKTLSNPAWWCWKFYKLRNSIVHGDNIKFTELIYSNWITQSIVADIVFYNYVVESLVDLKALEPIKKPDFTNIYNLFKWI